MQQFTVLGIVQMHVSIVTRCILCWTCGVIPDLSDGTLMFVDHTVLCILPTCTILQYATVPSVCTYKAYLAYLKISQHFTLVLVCSVYSIGRIRCLLYTQHTVFVHVQSP